MKYSQRDQEIKRFRESTSIRVLVISQVSNNGLNLNVASIVIFLVSLGIVTQPMPPITL
jgi:SNF2 family DNA or RNA helicase